LPIGTVYLFTKLFHHINSRLIKTESPIILLCQITIKPGRVQGENTVMIKTIFNVGAQQLTTIAIGILDSPQLLFYLVTAYPGSLEASADFPNARQSATEQAYSREY